MTEGPNYNFIVFYLILRKNWEWYKDHQKIPILTVLNLRFICAENYDGVFLKFTVQLLGRDSERVPSKQSEAPGSKLKIHIIFWKKRVWLLRQGH